MAKFILNVSHTQVAVFDGALAAPFNDWTDEHVAQGFSWRPGSVSFGTIDSIGPIDVQVFHARAFDEGASRAARTIAVPFTVPEHGAIEVASIGGSAALELPSGNYELIFEHGRDGQGAMWANLYFQHADAPVQPRILRADAELSPPVEFVMTADPA